MSPREVWGEHRLAVSEVVSRGCERHWCASGVRRLVEGVSATGVHTGHRRGVVRGN